MVQVVRQLQHHQCLLVLSTDLDISDDVEGGEEQRGTDIEIDEDDGYETDENDRGEQEGRDDDEEDDNFYYDEEERSRAFADNEPEETMYGL